MALGRRSRSSPRRPWASTRTEASREKPHPWYHTPSPCDSPCPAIHAAYRRHDAAADPGLHCLGVDYVQVLPLGEVHAVVRVGLEYAIDDDYVGRRVGAQGRSEPMREGDGTGPRLRSPPGTALAQVALDGVGEDLQGAVERLRVIVAVIPRSLRQGQDPLAHRQDSTWSTTGQMVSMNPVR